MRSGKLNATNDLLIEELLKDPNYDIREDGTIWTLITISGNRSVNNVWRKGGTIIDKRKNSHNYYSLRYKGHRIQIHRVIYRKFIGPLESDLVINHKDRNGLNNNPSNLELVTLSQNMAHVYTTGRDKK